MKSVYLVLVGLIILATATGCPRYVEPQGRSGIKTVTAGRDVVKTNSTGHTVEQQNILDRMRVDNLPGEIKHLYVISAYSGQVILYSPVKGKVGSSGKRLNPSKIGSPVGSYTMPSFEVGGQRYYTDELPTDDGTYGPSIEYLYWFNPTTQAYHQHYLGGGQIVHVSDQPVSVKGVVINLAVEKGNN